MKPTAILLVVLLVPLAAAQPEGSVTPSSPSVNLAIDTRYASSDYDWDSVSITIRNVGDAPLELDPLGTATSGGVTVTCASGCSGTTLNPGSSRFASLTVEANEDASRNTAVSYPIRFGNAPTETIRISASISRLEAGHVQATVSYDTPAFPCPAPSTIPVSGTIRLSNPGDTTVSGIDVDVGNSQFSISSAPSSLSPGASRSITFSRSVAPTNLDSASAISGTVYFSSTRVMPTERFSSFLNARPPVDFQAIAGSQAGLDIFVGDQEFTILSPREIPLKLEENCGYQGATFEFQIPANTGTRMAPTGAWHVGPRGEQTGLISVTLGLADLPKLCTGFASRITFVGAYTGGQAKGAIEISGSVDLAGVRQRLDGLATLQVPSEAEDVREAFATNMTNLLGGSGCGGSVQNLVGLLSTTGPLHVLAKAHHDYRNADNEVQAAEAARTVFIMGPVAAPQCTAFSAAELAEQCRALVAALDESKLPNLDDLLGALGQQSREGDLSSRVEAAEAMLRLATISGSGSAEDARAALSTNIQLLQETRTKAWAILDEQKQWERERLGIPGLPQKSDFQTWSPLTWVVANAAYRDAMQRYDKVTILAAQAGDDTLYGQAVQGRADIEAAHAAASGANNVMALAYAVAVVGLIGLAIARAVNWHGGRRMATAGDALFKG